MATSTLMFKKGDVIGSRYELHSALGRGGFGEVYLAYDRSAQRACALKTIRTEFLADVASKQTFKKEALLWVGLDEHAFIVTARWVEEFSGRLFVEMDYVAPDALGRVSLADHLSTPNEVLNIDQVLMWGIEFCSGMEHANSHGLKCHRDIKPSNILITQDGTLKITDFGLGTGAEALASGRTLSFAASRERGGFGFSFLQHEGKGVCGTPGYIAPEVILGESSSIRSDIYSFGLVLWQMAASSPVPPFHSPQARDADTYIREVFQQQMSGHVPQGSAPLQNLVERCLMPEPSRRPESFEALQTELKQIFRERTGRTFQIPVTGEKTATFWNNKGASLNALGRYQDALICFDKTLEIDPYDATAWNNKGNPLDSLGRHQEALTCYCKAIDIRPQDSRFWSNKALALRSLGRSEEALVSYAKAVELDPQNAVVWNNMAVLLTSLHRREEALTCAKKAVEIDPLSSAAWTNAGISFFDLGRTEQALASFAKAVEIDPSSVDALVKQGVALGQLGRHEDALMSFTKALDSDPKAADALTNMGLTLRAVGRPQDALLWLGKALDADPRSSNVCINIGATLGDLGQQEDAIAWYSKALENDPRDADAWFNKGVTLRLLGRPSEAVGCFQMVVGINPRDSDAWLDKARAEELSGDRRSAVLSFRKFLELAREEPGKREDATKVRDVLAGWGQSL